MRRSRLAARAASGDNGSMGAAVRYVKGSGGYVAYSVSGSGPIDIAYIHGGWGHLELRWEEPGFARLLERLGRIGRLIMFDRRGTGLSDRTSTPASVADHVDDLRAVLDVVGARTPVLFGVADGAAVAVAHAVADPERVSALVLYAAYAKALGGDAAGPGLALPMDQANLARSTDERWGDPWLLDVMAPSRGRDEGFIAWWRRYQQASVSPDAARALITSMTLIDVTAELPRVGAPTLVLHREGDRLVPLANGQAVAAAIPGATLKVLPGDDYMVYAGDVDSIADEIESFLGVAPAKRARQGSGTGLSAREAEVALLVADGLTNRQVAGRLVISERTVESHVASILRKLGLRTRSQIATWATREKLTETP